MSDQLKKPDLNYPFTKRWSPEVGQPFEVADGVFWLRMSLPIDLDHINLWLLKDGDDSWTIVDAGYDAPECKDIWLNVIEHFLAGQTVKQIIITHFHPDHIGLAAWLAHQFNAPILISKGEFDHYDNVINRDAEAFKQTSLRFAKKIGFDNDMASSFSYFFGASNKPDDARVKPEMCDFIQDGDTININGLDWSVVSGSGHSPEHSCLYCRDLNVLISGDQAIARISSNVGVYPSDPNANPLHDWLTSCEKLRDTIPANTLILPSHQEPFIGIDLRMQTLIDDHHSDLNKLMNGLESKKRVVDARKIIFDRQLNQVNTVLAIGETLAHLNYLLAVGQIQVQIEDGVAYYQVA